MKQIKWKIRSQNIEHFIIIDVLTRTKEKKGVFLVLKSMCDLFILKYIIYIYIYRLQFNECFFVLFILILHNIMIM